MKVKQTSVQFLLYFIIGGLATIVEWTAFYVLNTIFHIHYTSATALAFILSTVVNWLSGRLILFKKSKQNVVKELVKIYTVSIIGLLMNIALMFIFVEKMEIQEMIAKIITTGSVFIWNFLIRKLVIYKI